MKTGSGTFVKADFLLSRHSSCGWVVRWVGLRRGTWDVVGTKALLQEGRPPCFLLCDLLQEVAPHRAPLSGVSIRKGLKRQVQLMTNCLKWQKNFNQTPNDHLRDHLVHGRGSSLRKTHKKTCSLLGVSHSRAFWKHPLIGSQLRHGCRNNAQGSLCLCPLCGFNFQCQPKMEFSAVFSASAGKMVAIDNWLCYFPFIYERISIHFKTNVLPTVVSLLYCMIENMENYS